MTIYTLTWPLVGISETILIHDRREVTPAEIVSTNLVRSRVGLSRHAAARLLWQARHSTCCISRLEGQP